MMIKSKYASLLDLNISIKSLIYFKEQKVEKIILRVLNINLEVLSKTIQIGIKKIYILDLNQLICLNN